MRRRVLRPGLGGERGGAVDRHFGLHGAAGGFLRRLKFRAQPAHHALGFLGAALIQTMHDALRRPRVMDAGGETPGDANHCSTSRSNSKPPSEGISAVSKRTSICRPRIGDRPGRVTVVSSFAGMARPNRCELVSTSKSYTRSTACTRAHHTSCIFPVRASSVKRFI